ncbi:MAG: ArgR family transcriptional regulator, partial [Oscillospiraceae bacterium]|nr:ArgR family transcriptional regulator [Oscillospiraceae bacterium]
LHSVLGSLVVAVDYAMNTVVVKCQTGMAQAVCAKLDAAKLPQVVGTLAGDDTIFVLVRNEQAAQALVDELKNDIKA